MQKWIATTYKNVQKKNLENESETDLHFFRKWSQQTIQKKIRTSNFILDIFLQKKLSARYTQKKQIVCIFFDLQAQTNKLQQNIIEDKCVLGKN